MRTIFLIILLLLMPNISRAETSSQYCLAIAAYTEARNQDQHGMALVMHTVLVRAKKRKKTPCQIIYQPSQYYGVLRWPKGAVPKTKTWLQAVNTADQVLSDKWDFGVCKGAEYFYAPMVVKKRPSWSYSVPKLCSYKGHNFHGRA